MIPAGKHNARGLMGTDDATRPGLVEAKTGNPGVSVIVVVEGGDHDGTRLRWDGWLTDTQMGDSTVAQRTIESLRYMGWQGELLTDLTGIDANLVQIVVEHETRDINGEMKTFPKVVWVNRLGGGSKIANEARVQGNAANQLAQRFRSLARGVPVSVQGAAPRAAAPTTRQPSQPQHRSAPRNGSVGKPPPHAPDAPEIDDDKIPF